ncbi:MAG: type II toxin-antitoxin system HicB family antitoxin [Candidatus Electrothrix sp. GW3-4]|uniref:type II toxin-antitoxin system HicB family antitoxin n=1 Tax=Candidatus Electrothrix sp. GW3-4 TaxID=3126740 RepID=UPI0030D362AC
MMNIVDIDGYRAVISYDPKHGMFCGEFAGLSSKVVFYSQDIGGLLREGKKVLDTFLDSCQEDGVEPRKEYSGELLVQIHPGLHAEVVARAFASGKTVNQWLAEMIEQVVCAY